MPATLITGIEATTPEQLSPFGAKSFPSLLCDDHVGIPALKVTRSQTGMRTKVTSSLYSGALSSTRLQLSPSLVPTNIALTGNINEGWKVSDTVPTCEVEEESEACGAGVDHGAGESKHPDPGHLSGEEDDGHEEAETMAAFGHDECSKQASEGRAVM